jgi:hypothetical protein
MHTELVTEMQGKSPQDSPMSVVTSIAVINMKACAERIAVSAARLAQNPRRADVLAERTRQTLDVVEFEAHMGTLKKARTNAKAKLDISA